MKAMLQGRVLSNGKPVPGAKIRLLGGEDTLGADPRATRYDPTAVSWTRSITGFEGNAWNCWQKFVARTVAGLTWQEFRAEVDQYNPSLRETDGQFLKDRAYLVPGVQIPESVYGTPPEIVWDRQVTGLSGNRWACWRNCAGTKVLGLDWETFRQEVAARNPALALAGNHFIAGETYVLPRDAGKDQYSRVAFSRANGGYRFKDLAPGSYELVVLAEGYEMLHEGVEIRDSTVLDLELIALSLQDVIRDLEIDSPGLASGGDSITVTSQPIRRVRVQGARFFVGDQPFRFIGVNLRALTHYGTGTFKSAEAKDRIHQLDAASQMGARVVRLFLAAKDASRKEVGDRLEAVLALLKEKYPGMYLIVSFTDLYSTTPFHPKGDDDFYKKQPDGWEYLDRSWFAGGYQDKYLKLVKHVVNRFKAENHILAWELGNELKAYDAPDLFTRFNHAVAKFVRDRGARQLVTTGMLNTQHVHMFGRRPKQEALYRSPFIDFITCHIYNGGFDYSKGCKEGEHTHHGQDSKLANEIVGKPWIVEEAGFDARSGDNRTDQVRADVRAWINDHQARGYMQWGFMAGNRDIGDGDRCRGMDRQFHSDWDGLFQVYRECAQALAEGRPC